MRKQEEDLPMEEVVDDLRDAHRSGQFFAGRKYRTALHALARIWYDRNTPEFFVAASELTSLIEGLRNDEPAE